MARVDNTAEGGSNGTTVTTGNSGGASGTAFSAVTIGAGNTLTFSNATVLFGTMSYLFVVGTAANVVTCDLSVAANASGSEQFLFRWNGLPSATIQGPAILRGGGATQARTQVNTSGQVQISIDTNGSFSSGSMTTGVTYRGELIWYNFNTAASIVVFNVYNYLTGALVLTCSHMGTTTSTIDVIRFGKNGGTATLTGLIMDRLYTDSGKLNEFGLYPDAYLHQTWGTDPIDTRVEIYTGSSTSPTPTWLSVVRHENTQAGVYGGDRSEITINRDKSDETKLNETVNCSLQLNNRDGRYSPQNPMSPYYGYINKNTPLRVSVPAYESFMQLNAGSTAAATTPDSTALSITSDIDIRVNADIDNWWAQDRGLLEKYTTTGNQRAYQMIVQEDGYLRLQWSTNGTNNVNTISTVALPFQSGRWSVRATLDVNNGSGGYTVVWYYSADTNLTTATWTTLDTLVTTAGTTSIFDSTATVQLGDNKATDVNNPDNYDKFYSAQIRSGIAGTIVANPDFTTLTGGTAVFHDTAASPNIWTMLDAAYVEDRDYRFYGEINQWPVKWDTSGSDVWVDIEASGPLYRLGQGSQSTGSAMRRSISVHPSMVGYWHVEDGEDATVPTTGAANGLNMTEGALVVSDFAAYEGTFRGTDTLANINLNAWGGGIKSYTPNSPAAVELNFLFHAPTSEIPTSTPIMRLFTTGTASRWDIVYTTTAGGSLEVQAFDSDNVSILSGGVTDFDIDNGDFDIWLQLVQNGTGIDWELGVYPIDNDTFYTFDSGTLASRTISRATGVHVNPPGSAGADDVAYGQIAVYKAIVTDLDSAQAVMADAYKNESACNRINRLCDEEGVIFHERGARGSTTAQGYQLNDTVLNLINKAAETDGGWLYEDRERNGLVYRTRTSMYASLPALTLDYDLNQMLRLDAVDGPIFNDVTVKKIEGGSYRAVLEEGKLSVLSPPNGVGRYAQSYDLSLSRENQPDDQAGWRLSKGTVDEPRFTITLELAQNEFASSASLRAQIRALDIGQRLDITNPPDWMPPDTFKTIVQGYTEVIGNLTHTFTFHTQPFYPWQVGYYSGTSGGISAFYPTEGARYSPMLDTVIAEDLTTTETGIDITNGRIDCYFTHADGDYDIIIGGERMTVTAVSGTGLSQTLTVTRSVNGVVKAHSTGAEITLFVPEHYGI